MGPSAESDKIPVNALRPASIDKLSWRLNVRRIIPTDDGLPRDWRGLAHLIGLSSADTESVGSTQNPTKYLIKHWNKGTISDLQGFLEKIGRFDVVDDTKVLIEQDIEVFLTQPSIVQLPETPTRSAESAVLTVHDVARAAEGLSPQMYDAFLLFADEDVDFAMEIVEKMEQEHNMTICLRDHLVGGVTFEHDAVTKLIAERCRRLLVVVSPVFLESPSNKFVVTFAQAIGIDRQERKVIPIIYKKCTLPPELSYYFALKYYLKLPWDFWDTLKKSIAAADVSSSSSSSSSPWMTHSSEYNKVTPIVQSNAVEPSAPEASLETSDLKEITSSTNTVELEKPNLKVQKSPEEKAKNPISKAFKLLSQTISPEKKEDNVEKKEKKKKKGIFGKKKAEPLLAQ